MVTVKHNIEQAVIRAKSLNSSKTPKKRRPRNHSLNSSSQYQRYSVPESPNQRDLEISVSENVKPESLNSSAEEEVEDFKITTESGNEVPVSEIKVIQNPDTNEIMLYIPEEEDEKMPEGFAVIGSEIGRAHV